MDSRLHSRPPWEQHDASPAVGTSGESSPSDSPTTFEFLNDKLEHPTGGYTSFRIFEKLPLDLQRHIWLLSLPEKRLLKVTLAAGKPASNSANDPDPALYQSKNHLGNIFSGANYQVHLRSTETNSPLLYVNHEANDIVRLLYRVRIPITQRRLNADVPLLRFCPERDTIVINFECNMNHDECNDAELHFAHFVHDALAYDPRKKGILHMGFMTNTSHILLPVGLPNLHDRAQAALTSTLKNLESVSLVHLIRENSRDMSQHLLQHILLHQIPDVSVVRFNRAYPLWSSVASYSTLPVDTRPVSRYLDFVECGEDPLRAIRAWRKFEAAYNVNPTSPDKIRVLLAVTEPEEDLQVATTYQARYFRQQEELCWKRRWEDRWGYYLNYSRLKNPDTQQDIEFSKTQNAVGFWSVPLEAFGPVPEVPDDFWKWLSHRVCDFTAYESRIELGLFMIA